ncbi:MAG TPA: SRPBCC domain-containing protein [Polyangia bacterium]|nr:SRPBCC domain-containing protein [Polyangia bacterium]
MSETAKRRRITMERTFDAPIEDVWELWTTKEGLESWWGPEGFSVEVHAIDLRVGGEMRYAMRATAPEVVEGMKRMGLPLVTESRLTYTEISPHRRLAYLHLADFVPGVAAYDVATEVELAAGAAGVRMVVTVDAMHDERWTEMAVKGWESQLGKAARALAARKPQT